MTHTFKPAATGLILTAAIGLSACSINNGGALQPTADELEARAAALSEQENTLQQRQAELDRREQELLQKASGSSAESIGAIPVGDITDSTDLLPSDATPGECYTRVWVPPEYKQVKERVLVRDASEKISVTPATFRTVEKRVLIQEAATRLETVPATYKSVTERVLVKPASKKIVQEPAVYETIEERVLDKPAHSTWQKGTGPIQRIDDTTGEIMCLVEVPASYKVVTRRVLKSPASSRVIEQPAIYKSVTKKVVDIPAHTRTIEIPAQYRTVQANEIATPAQETRTEIPAEYATVMRSELVSDGFMEWRSILCDTNITRDRIAAIQQALLDQGFDPGPIDGVIGVETMRAVNAYQRSNNLPVDSYLNIATVKSLGVTPK